MLPLAGTWTIDSFSQHLAEQALFENPPERDVYVDYRRWGFESAALDLALRQTGQTLGQAVGRELRPLTYVVSMRLGEPPTLEPVHGLARALPHAALQARRDERLDGRARRAAPRARLRGLRRLQGPLHAGRSSTRAPTRRSTDGSSRAFPASGSRTRRSTTRRGRSSRRSRRRSRGTRSSTRSRTSRRCPGRPRP